MTSADLFVELNYTILMVSELQQIEYYLLSSPWLWLLLNDKTSAIIPTTAFPSSSAET